MDKLKPTVYNGNRCIIHASDDIAVLVKAYNIAAQKINELEERIRKLEQEAGDD